MGGRLPFPTLAVSDFECDRRGYRVEVRDRPRFIEQVVHQTMGNKHFFTEECHRQTKIMNRADKNWAYF
jgi:hypothetical protein